MSGSTGPARMEPLERRLALTALSLALLFGASLRLVNLGGREYDSDELDHLYAARSIEATGRPLLPSGNEYVRARLFTEVVRSFTGGEMAPESWTRLPAAVAGVGGLVALAALAWSVGGPWTAFWAVMLLAMFPEAIVQSRRVRFYSFQALLLLGAMAAAWGAANRADATVARRWALVAAALLQFTVALQLQVTTVSVLTGWVVALALLGAADALGRERVPFRRNVSLQALAGFGVAGVVGVAADPGLPGRLWAMSQMLPSWMSQPGSPLSFYHYYSDHLPVLVALSPLALAAVALSRPRLATFCAAWFLVPFLLHSGVFPFKGQRFLLGAVGALFLLCAEAMRLGAGALRRGIGHALREKGLGDRPARVGSAVGVATAAAVLIVTTPAFNAARKIPDRGSEHGWRMAALLVDSIAPAASLPVGTSFSLPARYYLPRVDFTYPSSYRRAGRENGTPPQVEGGRLRDFYGGLPVLVEADSILRAFPGHSMAIIVGDEVRLESWETDAELRAMLYADARETCRGRCGKLRVYAWNMDASRQRKALEGHTH